MAEKVALRVKTLPNTKPCTTRATSLRRGDCAGNGGRLWERAQTPRCTFAGWLTMT